MLPFFWSVLMKLREREYLGGGLSQGVYTNEEGDLMIVRNQDVRGILKDIEADRDVAKGKELWHVASLPLALIDKWREEEGFDWFTASEKERRAKLNDPDNAIFRVLKCKV